jgi:hypothetical protein
VKCNYDDRNLKNEGEREMCAILVLNNRSCIAIELNNMYLTAVFHDLKCVGLISMITVDEK